MKTFFYIVLLIACLTLPIRAGIFDDVVKKQLEIVRKEQKEAEKKQADLRKEITTLKTQAKQEKNQSKAELEAKQAALEAAQAELEANKNRRNELDAKERELDNRETKLTVLQVAIGGGGLAVLVALAVAIRNFRTSALTDEKLKLEAQLVQLSIEEKKRQLGQWPGEVSRRS